MNKVVVTGAAGAIGMDVAFSLTESGDYVIGVEADKDNFLLVKNSCKYYKKVYRALKSGEDGYKERINEIISEEDIDIVIPNPDSEVGFISSIRDDIRANMLLPSDKTVKILLSKLDTAKVLGDLAPETYEIENKDDLKDVIKIEKKIWLRPKSGAGGRGSIIVSDPEFGWMWIKYWKERGVTSSWIAQELLEGGNFNVTLIYDKHSELCGLGMMERLSYIHEANSPTGVTGDVRIAETVNKRDIIEIAKEAVKKIDSNPVGIFSVDLIGGKITEINPRFAGRPRLYTSAGANLPELVVKIIKYGTADYIEAETLLL